MPGGDVHRLYTLPPLATHPHAPPPAFTPWPGKVESPTQYRPWTAVRLKGMPSMPSGRREGMGPYEPSDRLRKRRCVRGVPTSLRAGGRR